MNNEKPKIIGYFETWNSEAGMIEKSSSRLQSLLVIIYLFFIDYVYWYDGGNFGDWGFITFNLLMLVAAFTPKYLKDLAEHAKKK